MSLFEQIMQRYQTSRPRRNKMNIGPFSLNFIDTKHPWVPAWWSAAMPGFGHIHLGQWIKGLTLLSGEIVINLYGKVNSAILYSFTGRFDRLHAGVVNYDFVFLYAALYVFGIWDSYRIAVDMNKISYLESKQEVRNFRITSVSNLSINFLDKRNPWLAAFWSMIFTGIGHIYNHKLLNGFILLGWTLAISIHTHLPQIIIFTLTGKFERINEVVNYQWLLFTPSIYLFGIYDAYSSTVGYNRLFKEEQMYYLKSRFRENQLDIV